MQTIKTSTGKEFLVVSVIEDPFNGMLHIVFVSAVEDEIKKVFSKKKEIKELTFNDGKIDRVFTGYVELATVYVVAEHYAVMLKK